MVSGGGANTTRENSVVFKGLFINFLKLHNYILYLN